MIKKPNPNKNIKNKTSKTKQSNNNNVTIAFLEMKNDVSLWIPQKILFKYFE